jgi:hypothetical protein
MGNDDTSSDELVPILERLASMAATEITVIGELPPVILHYWPNLPTRFVVITGERREHYRAGRSHYLDSIHALEEFERQIILTVCDPDEIYRNAAQSYTAILWRRLPSGRHMRVVIALAADENLSNSVITAWRPNARKYRRARELGRLLWERV